MALVALGALSAAAGRCMLARATRKVAHRLPARMGENIDAARQRVRMRGRGLAAALGSSCSRRCRRRRCSWPSGCCASASPFLLAFFLGRLISYSLYVSAATPADQQLGDVLGSLFGSSWSIALQLGLLAAVWVLPMVDWRRMGPTQTS